MKLVSILDNYSRLKKFKLQLNNLIKSKSVQEL